MRDLISSGYYKRVGKNIMTMGIHTLEISFNVSVVSSSMDFARLTRLISIGGKIG